MASETFKNCYFYTFSNGELKVYSGDVVISPTKPEATFIRDIDRNDRKNVVCSKEPGEILRKGLWLKRRDDKKAKSIFQEYANNKIIRSKSNLHMYEKMLNSTKRQIQPMF